jgi:hypothetical protein
LGNRPSRGEPRRTLYLGQRLERSLRRVTVEVYLQLINNLRGQVGEDPQKPPELLLARRFHPALENSAMYILQALALLFLTQAVLAQQPTPILPDAKLTPGDTFDVTAQDVCVPGYAKKVRAVPAWLKRQAYAEYRITEYKTGDYEVDHLIPLSLGGSNSIRNLWPQSTKTSPWNSYVKDALERLG